MILPAPLERLITALSRFPGVGEKTATRLAFFILRQKEEYARELGEAVVEAYVRIGYCEQCHNISEESMCAICVDTRRSPSTLCIVEGVPELMAIEATGEFQGQYHVLHGVLAPLKGVGPMDLKFASLQSRLAAGGVEELIVATSVGVEGEATALYAKRIAAQYDVKITRIASGIPMGGDLEYMDQVTLSRALSGRREL